MVDETSHAKQMRTHYEVLNLEKNCSAKEIKESFIKLSKKYHPDKNKDSDAHKRFVEVNEAYSVLGKPTTRFSYDATLSRPGPQRMNCSTGAESRRRAVRSQEIAKFLRDTKEKYSKMGTREVLLELEKAAAKKDLKRVKQEP